MKSNKKGVILRTTIPVKFRTDKEMKYIKSIIKQLDKKKLLDHGRST